MPVVKACLKWATIILNIIIFLIAALAAETTIFEHMSKVDDGYEVKIPGDRIFEFTMMAAIILGAIAGCIGAYSNNRLILILYMQFWFTLLLCQLIFALYFNEKEQCHATEKFVIRLWENKDKQPGPMNHLQNKYMCCGKYGASDYTKMQENVPQSCFYAPTMRLSDMHHLNVGCIGAVHRVYLNNCEYIHWTHFVQVFLEVMGILLALVIYIRKTKNNNKDSCKNGVVFV